MKHMPLAAALFLLVSACACSKTAERVAEHQKEATQSLRADAERADDALADEVAEFRRDARNRLSDIDARADRLERRAGKAADAVQHHAQREVQQIHARRQALERRLAQTKSTTRNQWKNEKRQIIQQLNAFAQDAHQRLDRLADEIEGAPS